MCFLSISKDEHWDLCCYCCLCWVVFISLWSHGFVSMCNIFQSVILAMHLMFQLSHFLASGNLLSSLPSESFWHNLSSRLYLFCFLEWQNIPGLPCTFPPKTWNQPFLQWKWYLETILSELVMSYTAFIRRQTMVWKHQVAGESKKISIGLSFC